jgi:Domain of unknown function (DUF397)
MSPADVQPKWRKSTFCAHSNTCVEVATTKSGEILVRDSKDSSQGVLRFSSDEWSAFINGVKVGEFDT